MRSDLQRRTSKKQRKTYAGRIVYDRPPHTFGRGDLYRVLKTVIKKERMQLGSLLQGVIFTWIDSFPGVESMEGKSPEEQMEMLQENTLEMERMLLNIFIVVALERLPGKLQEVAALVMSQIKYLVMGEGPQ